MAQGGQMLEQHDENDEALKKVIIEFGDEIVVTQDKLLERGVYVLRLIKMVKRQWEKVNEEGKHDEFLVGYFFIEHEGRKIWIKDYFSLVPTKRWKIRLFLNAMGLNETDKKIAVDFENLYGKTVKAVIDKKPNTFDTFKNYIKSYARHMQLDEKEKEEPKI